jgi:hypothetical protein
LDRLKSLKNSALLRPIQLSEVHGLFHLSCEVTLKSYLIFHGGVNVELLLDLLDGGLLKRVGLGHQLSKVVVHSSKHVVADSGQPKIINLLLRLN